MELRGTNTHSSDGEFPEGREMGAECEKILNKVKATVESFDCSVDSWPDVRHLEIQCSSSVPGVLWDENLHSIECGGGSAVGSLFSEGSGAVEGE